MKKILICGIAAAAALGMTANAQKFAIKAYDNIVLSKPMSVTSSRPGLSPKTSANSFGIDFGWKFWEKGANMLEANIGIGYSFLGATFGMDDLNYTYSAPATADDDGNPYQRYYQIHNLKQKSTVGYLQVPIYVDYEYRCARWLGIYAEAGVSLGFKVFNSTGSVSGESTAFGVFPEYDDLLIDESYLDHFGTRSLYGSKKADTKTNAFDCSILCGAGFEFFPYQPVSFVVGVRYMAGVTNVFKTAADAITGTGTTTFNGVEYLNYTADQAPVTYTAWQNGNFVGQTEVKSLADWTTKSKFMPLNLHVGVNIRF